MLYRQQRAVAVVASVVAYLLRQMVRTEQPVVEAVEATQVERRLVAQAPLEATAGLALR